MKRKLLVTFIALLLPSISVGAEGGAALTLDGLLKESGLELNVGNEFVDAPIDASAMVQYEKAYRTRDDKLEVRYMIRPLSRIVIDYEDPHSAVPEPNHMFNMLFHTLVGNLTQRGSRSPTKDYSKQMSEEHFNADWASVAAFDVVPEFSGDYRQALMIAVHKNDKADAYTIFLYNDYNSVKETVEKAMTSLKFQAGN